jgi:hypothetical protein
MSSQQGDEFKVGDVVWDVFYGKGSVTDVSSISNFPISVKFDNNKYVSYVKEGSYSEGAIRTLFFSEPKVEGSITRPFVSTLVGKTVVVQCYGMPRKDVIKVEKETADRIFIEKERYYLKADVETIYEVLQENLLKKG